MRADGGLRTDFFGHRESALKKLMQQSAQRAGLLGRAHGVFHLTENLRLAQHHGIQPAGHAKRSEEHTSELQSLMRISYAVFCLKKKNKTQNMNRSTKQINIYT